LKGEDSKAQEQIAAFLYRKIVKSEFVENPNISARLATGKDALTILSIHDGFFGDFSEVKSYLDEDGLFLYFAADGAAVGCGILKRITSDQNYFDIGMVVAPDHRRKTIGSHIISRLKNHCLQLGYQPVCGCAWGNESSRGALEKAGFVSEHNLVIAGLIITDSFLAKATSR
jgi:GNAT superfamily N-acetyltransferase